MGNRRIKVAVGLSGGVDSSVAAALLCRKGYDVIGIAMEIYNGPEGIRESDIHTCYGPGEKEDTETAALVCEKLGLPFFVIDLREEFNKYVIDYLKKEYLSGRTPNPCVVCNRHLKFDFLLGKAKSAGIDFDFFATGHYARIDRFGEKILLRKASDPAKDQTYFLYRLTDTQLSHALFPLGHLKKQKVREIARDLGLITAERPESQNFMTGEGYSSLFHPDEQREGDIVSERGEILGKHGGIVNYTVGQRRGLGVASSSRLYVTRIDASRNQIVVGYRKDLFSEGLIASDLSFITHPIQDQPYRAKVKIRFRHTEVPATVFPNEKDRIIKVIFDRPQTAVTPGQSVVLYSGDAVLGGGTIEQAV